MTEEMGKKLLPVYEKAECIRSLLKEEILLQNSHAGLVFDRFPMMWWIPYRTDSTLDQ